MKIDFVFLLKAIKENQNIFIYHKQGERTQRYFSRFFLLDSQNSAIVIDFPYIDGYLHKNLSPQDPICVIFHTAGFRFHFDTTIIEKDQFPIFKGVKIPTLKITYPKEILDGNRRSLFRIAVYLEKSVLVKYKIWKTNKKEEPKDFADIIGVGGIEAIMIDISENGTAIKVNRKIEGIEVGNHLKLSFNLEEKDNEEIEIEGTICNIRQFPGSNVEVWGIEFIDSKTQKYKQALQKITCYLMSRNQENVGFFTVNQLVSKNPYVQKIVDHEVTEDFLEIILSGKLPLTEEEYLESLVFVLKIQKFKKRAASKLLMIPFSIKENYIKRKDANHRVAFYILMEALNHSHTPIISSVINNQYLPPEFLLKIAEEGNNRILRILLANKIKLIAYPEIIEAMEANPALNSEIKTKIKKIKNSYLEDRDSLIIPTDETRMDVAEWIEEMDKKISHFVVSEEKDEAKKMALSCMKKINQMTMQERIRLAITGMKSERMILSKDKNPMVVQAVIENPGIKEGEILRILQDEKTDHEIISKISKNIQWMKNYTIMLAVLKHPGVSVKCASEYLQKLNLRDLRDISEHESIQPEIRAMATSLIESKGKFS